TRTFQSLLLRARDGSRSDGTRTANLLGSQQPRLERGAADTRARWVKQPAAHTRVLDAYVSIVAAASQGRLALCGSRLQSSFRSSRCLDLQPAFCYDINRGQAIIMKGPNEPFSAHPPR